MSIWIILLITCVVTVFVNVKFLESRTVDGKITEQVEFQSKIVIVVTLLLVGTLLMPFKSEGEFEKIHREHCEDHPSRCR
jgi:hypothetical protein